MNPKNKNSLCILPWIHMHLHQNGQIYPCCYTEGEYSYGPWENKTLMEIWNSENFKKIRKSMLAGKKISACTKCYSLEKLNSISLRQRSNSEFKKFFKRIKKTKPDGHLDFSNVPYLQIQFSNICNFKCRSCNIENSNQWKKDHNLLFNNSTLKDKYRTLNTQEKWKQLEELIPQVEKFYFLGGEPLLEKDHYRVLDCLIQLKKFETTLHYASNLSTLKFGHYDILKLWDKFKNISLVASVDGVGPQLELLRKGARWNAILTNIQLIKEKHPHISLVISPTLSAMNAFHITEAIDVWLQKGLLLKKNDIDFNFLVKPSYLSVSILNKNEKMLLKEHYDAFICKIKNSSFDKALIKHIEENLNTALNMAPQKNLELKRKQFRFFTLSLDKSRKENFVKMFPEHMSLLFGD